MCIRDRLHVMKILFFLVAFLCGCFWRFIYPVGRTAFLDALPWFCSLRLASSRLRFIALRNISVVGDKLSLWEYFVKWKYLKLFNSVFRDTASLKSSFNIFMGPRVTVLYHMHQLFYTCYSVSSFFERAFSNPYSSHRHGQTQVKSRVNENKAI